MDLNSTSKEKAKKAFEITTNSDLDESQIVEELTKLKNSKDI